MQRVAYLLHKPRFDNDFPPALRSLTVGAPRPSSELTKPPPDLRGSSRPRWVPAELLKTRFNRSFFLIVLYCPAWHFQCWHIMVWGDGFFYFREAFAGFPIRFSCWIAWCFFTFFSKIDIFDSPKSVYVCMLSQLYAWYVTWYLNRYRVKNAILWTLTTR